MRRGRPPSSGAALVEQLDGSQQARSRLGAILRVLRGELTVPQACEELGISPSRFHQMRQAALQEAVEALEPKPRGRPGQKESPEQQQLEALQQEVSVLKLDLRAAQVREELALVMPHVVHKPEVPAPAKGKKKKKQRRKGF